MIVSLAMYLPGGDAVQSFWAAVAGLLAPRLTHPAPDTLYWPQDLHAHWLEPTLLLSQTCGYPLSTSLRNKVQVVGTFAYDAPGCRGISCKSQLVRRSDDARTSLSQFSGSTLAFNSSDSQSGFNALRALIATTRPERPFFSGAVQTGGHYASIEKVRTGHADMAAVDCVTLAIWRDTYPQFAKDIAVFGETAAYPGLPLVTSLATPYDTLALLRECLAAVATEERFAAVRAPIRISGFETTGLDDYDVCLRMEKAGAPLFHERLHT
jgi:ABC-type phosphate/phosphonate transport system substrate-binding protein